MALKWPFGKAPREESIRIPQFYPDADELELAQFLSEDEYARIKTFTDTYILPFVWEGSAPRQLYFGMGLHWLMMRNLMLLRDVSIHGPEDTSSVAVPWEGAKDLSALKPRSCFVSGVAELGGSGYALDITVYRAGRSVNTARARSDDWATFVSDCTTKIGQGLGSRLETTVADVWTIGQPEDANSLIRCGELEVRFGRKNVPGKLRAVERALHADPGCALAAMALDQKTPDALRIFIEALKRDPYNAQICFEAFCAVWKSAGPQEEAMQFCRRAIELSPGHGKAHMCAPHAAHPHADMLKHSELGYRLLPGNTFAISNFVHYLERYGAPAEMLIELAEEGIAADPCAPSNYLRMIELYWQAGAYKEALFVAERLQKLFEPVMNERALYCLKQNPEVAQAIESGKYNPATMNRQVIAELRKKLQGN